MPIRKITLTEYLNEFVDRAVSSGRYADANDVIREALRMLEHRERVDELKLQRLRKAVQIGLDAIDRGEYIELNTPEDIDRFMERKSAEAAARRAEATGKPR